MEISTAPVSVYLSGHLHYEEFEWRARVMLELDGEGIRWLLPTRAGGTGNREMEASMYRTRDKLAIKQADVVFAVIEEHARNIGTTYEVGFAEALGRTVIVVNLCKNIESFDFLEGVDCVVYSLEDGIRALRFAVTKDNDHYMEAIRA